MRFEPRAEQAAGKVAPSREAQALRAFASPDAPEELCERYRLGANPSADGPGRFFEGGERQYYLERLRHLCSFGDMFLILTGLPGAGRSRLLREFWLQEKAHLEFRALKPEDCASVSQLAQALWSLLRRPMPPSCNPIQAITGFFQSAHWQAPSTKRRWVLLLDDADTLPAGVLEALALGFSQADRSRAPVPVVIATDGVVDRLRQQGGDGAHWLYPLAVRPLSEEESGQFIEHCFEGTGVDAPGLLDRERLRQLYLRSGGYFDRLKQIAPEMILDASASAGGPVAKRRRDRETPRRLGLWLMLAPVLLGASYAFVARQYDGPAVAPATLEANGHIDEVERLRLAMAEAERGMRDLPDEPAREIAAATRGAGQPGSGGAPSLPESADMAVAEVLAREPVAPLPELQPRQPAQATKLEIVDTAQPLAVDANQRAGLPSAGFEPRLPERFRNRAWIDQLAPGSLVVQLLASYSEETAVRLIKAHPDVDLIYLRSAFRERPWFVVLYGVYDSRTAARAASAELPQSLLRMEPWVRVTDGL